MAKKSRKPKTRRPVLRYQRHPFYFKRRLPSGKVKLETVWVRVRSATAPARLVVTEEHILYAKEHDGVGNSQTCAVAVCANLHNEAFNHGVVGPVSWLYRTCFVASKENKDGRLIECVAYRHDSKLAHLFDTEPGLDKLLAMVRKNGPITIYLQVPPKTTGKNKRTDHKKGKKTGTRTPKPKRGAKLRYAVADSGYTKTEEEREKETEEA